MKTNYLETITALTGAALALESQQPLSKALIHESVESSGFENFFNKSGQSLKNSVLVNQHCLSHKWLSFRDSSHKLTNLNGIIDLHQSTEPL